MALTADQWQQWATEKLPEQFRDNPDAFLEDYNKTRQEAQEGSTYREWYETKYKPWETQNKESLTEYYQWRARQAGGGGQEQSSAGSPGTAPARTAKMPEIDWDDPDAAKAAFQSAWETIRSVEDRLANETTTLRTEFARERDNVVQLVGLLQQAQEIEKQDLYGHLGYTPKRDIHEIAKFAAEHQIPDLNRAAQDRYGEEMTRAKIEQEVAKERERIEREYQNRQIVTERGSRGTPRGSTFRGEQRPAQGSNNQPRNGLRRGFKDYDGLYAAIAQKSPDIEWS